MKDRILRKKTVLAVFALGIGLVSYFILGEANIDSMIIDTVSSGEFARKISTTGVVEIRDEIELRAGVRSQVKEILVSEGQLVEKGQILIRLDDEDYRDAVTTAKLGVISAKNRLIQRRKERVARKLDLRLQKNKLSLARSVLTDAELNRNRSRTLFDEKVLSKKVLEDNELAFQNAETGKSIAAINLELAEINLDISQNNVQTAEIELKNAMIDQKKAERNLEKTEIKSNNTGVIVNEIVEEGMYVQIGSHLLSIGNPNVLTVELDVDEEDISEIKIDQKVEVEVESKVLPKLQGKVFEIAPKAKKQNNVNYFSVKVSLDGNQQFLKSGMSVDAEILTIEKSDVLTVPLTAVVREQKGSKTKNSLYVVSKENRIEKVEIDLGADNNYEAVVTDGINEGARIVVGDFDQINRLSAEHKSN